MASFSSSYCAWSIAPVLSRLCHLLNWSMHWVLSSTYFEGELQAEAMEVDREDVDTVEPESVNTCRRLLSISSLFFTLNGKSGVLS